MNSVIFGAVDAVLYRPLPYGQPDRLVALWEIDPAAGRRPGGTVSYANLLDLAEQNTRVHRARGFPPGTAERVEFRTTKIRDVDGRVHVVRNGDVKDVINYSKEYTLAVVPVDIVYDADLRGVFSVLREAGERLRAENPDVLAQTEIDGITVFGATAMTVRTSTRVKPGRHEAAAAALRFWIKEAFDRRAGSAARRGIVPADLVEASAPDPRDRREAPIDDAGSQSVRQRHPEPQG